MTVTWNPSDASANISLSGGNLTATTTSSTQGGVRCNSSASSGKIYFEVEFTVAPSGGDTGIGWANSTASLSSFFGINKNGVADFPQDGSSGQVWFNNASLGSGGGAGFKYCVVCIAFDIDNKLIWSRIGGLGWNGGASANPATGTGGYSVSTINAGPYFPCFCANASGQQISANFGATAFLFPIPSGFGTLDTSGAGYSNFKASTKFGGVGVLATPQNSAGATKFDGLGILGTPQNATVASKFRGVGVLGTPQNAAGATKLLGYGIIAPRKPKPFFHGFP